MSSTNTSAPIRTTNFDQPISPAAKPAAPKRRSPSQAGALRQPGTTIQPFPLYDRLLAKARASPQLIDARRIAATINNIPNTLSPEDASAHIRIIAVFCLHHELVENNGISYHASPYPPPYRGMRCAGGVGAIMNAAHLPPLLLQIIQFYVDGDWE